MAAIAEALWAAELAHTPTTTLAQDGLPLDLVDAYAIQRMNLIRRFERGEKTVGHKVGLTSKAMQEQLHVTAPDFGVITDAMLVASGGHLDLGLLIAPRIEAEFAFTLNQTFPGWARPSREELTSAISSVSLAIEIIDSRVIDWNVTLADTVADNASSGRIIVGPPRRCTPVLLEALPDTTLTLLQDGDPVATGLGAAVLGNPTESVYWISHALHQFGEGLHKGDTIMTGAVHASLPLTEQATWTVVADGFEPVQFTSRGR